MINFYIHVNCFLHLFQYSTVQLLFSYSATQPLVCNKTQCQCGFIVMDVCNQHPPSMIIGVDADYALLN